MSKPATAATVLAILLVSTACSSDEGKPEQDAVAAQESTCKEILGSSGVEWLRDQVGADGLLMKVTHDQKQAQKLFYKQMRSWEPKDSAAPYDPFMFADAHVCGASKKSEDSGKKFNLRFDASPYPFAQVSAGEGGTTTPANSDVTLASRRGDDGANIFEVYFKCAIPGARGEQEERLPIVGSMTDTLTGDRDARVHFQHLLHSAEVMARTLDCQNKPVIPAEPPASVK